MSDYLWDKSGDVDPEIERLERTLRVFEQSTPPPALDLRRPLRVRDGFPPPLRLRRDLAEALRAKAGSRSAMLIAASLALVVGGLVLALVLGRSTTAWQVTTAGGRSTLPVGAWLDTSAGEATMAVADIGTVTVEPGARVRLLDSRTGHHRMELARGTMHATIWAPPNQFFVETPSTLAVDLGCAYTLTVDEDGGGLVTVLVGWVGFSTGDRESFIPAGFAAVDPARHRARHAIQRARVRGLPAGAGAPRLQSPRRGHVTSALARARPVAGAGRSDAVAPADPRAGCRP